MTNLNTYASNVFSEAPAGRYEALNIIRARSNIEPAEGWDIMKLPALDKDLGFSDILLGLHIDKFSIYNKIPQT